MTYVHRGLSFESALLDAMMKIGEGSENILVGAIDEMTETSYTIQQRLGVLKGIAAGEGAQFFLLSREAGEHPLAEIQGIETFMGKQTTEEIRLPNHPFFATKWFRMSGYSVVGYREKQEATQSR